MEDKKPEAICDFCNIQKSIIGGEHNESIFVCNDCLYHPDYGFGIYNSCYGFVPNLTNIKRRQDLFKK